MFLKIQVIKCIKMLFKHLICSEYVKNKLFYTRSEFRVIPSSWFGDLIMLWYLFMIISSVLFRGLPNWLTLVTRGKTTPPGFSRFLPHYSLTSTFLFFHRPSVFLSRNVCLVCRTHVVYLDSVVPGKLLIVY